MAIEQDIKGYIDSNKLAWSPRTTESEHPRLLGLKEALIGDPIALWSELERKQIKPYSRVIYWVRVSLFWDWMIENGKAQGPNAYRAFRAKNRRLFRNTYEEKIPEISFEEAKERISQISNKACRNQAQDILLSGKRYFESCQHSPDGRVTGKGGKVRVLPVASKSRIEFRSSYSTFRRELAKVGLRPHDLRKVCVGKAVELGANEFELLEMFGWKQIQTATKYTRGKKSRVKSLFEQMRK